jgi:hypothetical protein
LSFNRTANKPVMAMNPHVAMNGIDTNPQVLTHTAEQGASTSQLPPSSAGHHRSWV